MTKKINKDFYEGEWNIEDWDKNIPVEEFLIAETKFGNFYLTTRKTDNPKAFFNVTIIAKELSNKGVQLELEITLVSRTGTNIEKSRKISLSNYSMIFTESNINNENNQHSLCYIHFSDSNIFNMKTEYNIKFDKTQNKNHLYVCEGNEECFQLIDHGFTSRDYHTTTTIIWNSPKIDNNTEYLKLSVSPSKSANQTITKSHIMSLKSFVQGTSYNALLSDENEYNNTNSNNTSVLCEIWI